METYGGFGNQWGFWKPVGVLETYRGFGNLWGFWKPIGVLETYRGFGNHNPPKSTLNPSC